MCCGCPTLGLGAWGFWGLPKVRCRCVTDFALPRSYGCSTTSVTWNVREAFSELPFTSRALPISVNVVVAFGVAVVATTPFLWQPMSAAAARPAKAKISGTRRRARPGRPSIASQPSSNPSAAKIPNAHETGKRPGRAGVAGALPIGDARRSPVGTTNVAVCEGP